jgi:hypothetical protein
MGRSTESFPPLEERFWAKVDRRGPDECWPWIASTLRNGYGVLQHRRKKVYAHRLSYTLNVGPIPDRHVIHHLCGNQLCVNPAHLQPILQGEHVLLHDTPSARHTAQTHCKNGHEFTPETTRLRANGSRRCLVCAKEYAARKYWTGGKERRQQERGMTPRQFRVPRPNPFG